MGSCPDTDIDPKQEVEPEKICFACNIPKVNPA